MGSPLSEADRNIDEVQHTVTLTQGFWMGDHEVTQQDYQELIGSNPSSFKGSNLPVESVSWNDAVEYCKKLTERERSAGRITAQQAYRLPTEAEWEYAARAESVETRPGELGPIAWWFGNSDSQTHVVKQKVANAWGLHDMLGNVWEWCSDVYWAYPTVSVIDPTGPSSGPLRVSRGGSWNENTKNVRSAGRLRDIPTSRGSDLGFRCVLSESR
jgi:formylglycine-generating enzyme required for sulfatase activity